MKKFISILNIFVLLINAFAISSAFAVENKKLEVVSNLDLNKFQGVWYEIAHNPVVSGKQLFCHDRALQDNRR